MRLLLFFFSILIFVFSFSSCQKTQPIPPQLTTENFDAQVVFDWYNLLIDLNKDNPNYTAPISARIYAYSGLLLYESVVPGILQNNSLKGKINGLNNLQAAYINKNHHWALVANTAMAYFFKRTFTDASVEKKQEIEDLEQYYKTIFQSQIDEETFNRSIDFGSAIAFEILKYAESDEQENAHLNNYPQSYEAPSGLGMWQKTAPDFQNALQPYWGNVRAFLNQNVSESQPQPPIPFSNNPNSPFYQDANEVYNAVKKMDNNAKNRVLYWSNQSDGEINLPSHLIAIALQNLENENRNLAQVSETLAKIGLALHDSYVACWKTKFNYNLLRPIDYIQAEIDADFLPFVSSPASPSYTPVASVLVHAFVEIMQNELGYNFQFTDETHLTRTDFDGSARTYISFQNMANEVDLSLFESGNHFQNGIDKAKNQGKTIGQNINRIAFKK